MCNKDLVELLHRLGKDAQLADWCWPDDTVLLPADFWDALGEFLKAIGIKNADFSCMKEESNGWEQQEKEEG